MRIGIDASRVGVEPRTGTENYSFYVIQKLLPLLSEHEVFLYTRDSLPEGFVSNRFDNVTVVEHYRSFMWSQVFLPLRAHDDHLDVLFVPSHVLPFLYRGKSLLTIHGVEFELVPEAYSLFQKLYLRATTSFGVNHASRIVVPSSETRDGLVDGFHAKAEKVEVISHGGILSQIPVEKKIDEDYFFFIGRPEKRKGFEKIINGFAEYRKKGGNFSLKLAGSFSDDVVGMIQSSGYKDHIDMLGYISDAEAAHYMKNTKCLVFPSVAEGFGMPVLDALQMGTPVISTATGFAKDFLEGNDLQCEYSTVDCVFEKMLFIEKNYQTVVDDFQKKMDFFKKFTWEASAQAHFEALMKILENKA